MSRILAGFTLELCPARPWLLGNAELAAFMAQHLNNQQIYEVKVQAAQDRLVLDPLGGVLNRTD
ncbi:hypothetical protein OHB26_18880 [Nocardia sp. NBC_01503]|uniref:hypothetical protein n=1 Tax=Nocardia sp. NBC_01503 TaxID=2975997 RepID=UPI002E7AC87E|nr:hypothetical protein [Nocardia sp. NBC_01503]WTL36595.1 hypothetical protein OHB26_18880 [Nocardia sp. NBC_01503]